MPSWLDLPGEVLGIQSYEPDAPCCCGFEAGADRGHLGSFLGLEQVLTTLASMVIFGSFPLENLHIYHKTLEMQGFVW